MGQYSQHDDGGTTKGNLRVLYNVFLLVVFVAVVVFTIVGTMLAGGAI